MKRILPMCCFCEKVRDDAGAEVGQGVWQDFRIYMVMYGLRPDDVTFSRTYCRDCLMHDARATARRTESGQPSPSVLRNG